MMTRFLGCLVVMDRDRHAQLIAATIAAQARQVDTQVRALAAETEIRRLREANRQLQVIAATLESANDALRETVRMDEALLGFGEGQG